MNKKTGFEMGFATFSIVIVIGIVYSMFATRNMLANNPDYLYRIKPDLILREQILLLVEHAGNDRCGSIVTNYDVLKEAKTFKSAKATYNIREGCEDFDKARNGAYYVIKEESIKEFCDENKA